MELSLSKRKEIGQTHVPKLHEVIAAASVTKNWRETIAALTWNSDTVSYLCKNYTWESTPTQEIALLWWGSSRCIWVMVRVWLQILLVHLLETVLRGWAITKVIVCVLHLLRWQVQFQKVTQRVSHFVMFSERQQKVLCYALSKTTKSTVLCTFKDNKKYCIKNLQIQQKLLLWNFKDNKKYSYGASKTTKRTVLWTFKDNNDNKKYCVMDLQQRQKVLCFGPSKITKSTVMDCQRQQKAMCYGHSKTTKSTMLWTLKDNNDNKKYCVINLQQQQKVLYFGPSKITKSNCYELSKTTENNVLWILKDNKKYCVMDTQRQQW